ncbi:MAG TPA: CopD family protein [Longimicrobium sp.]|nr:CopD family protein [Longimicrobium sp.]
MPTLYLLNVTLHLLAAVVWLAGIFFLALTETPAPRSRTAPAGTRGRDELERTLHVSRWAALAVLLVTGLLSLHFGGVLRDMHSATFWSSPYGRTLAWKLALVAATVVLAAAHDFLPAFRAARLDPASPERLRSRTYAAWLARANALLGIALLFASVRQVRGG